MKMIFATITLFVAFSAFAQDAVTICSAELESVIEACASSGADPMVCAERAYSRLEQCLERNRARIPYSIESLKSPIFEAATAVSRREEVREEYEQSIADLNAMLLDPMNILVLGLALAFGFMFRAFAPKRGGSPRAWFWIGFLFSFLAAPIYWIWALSHPIGPAPSGHEAAETATASAGGAECSSTLRSPTVGRSWQAKNHPAKRTR